MSRARAWIKAARLPSQSYIALPLLLGQVLAWRATDQWSWAIFALVQLFGVLDQLYIVWANDWADYDTDQDNQTPTIFSGGSRVLVDGELDRAQLGRAAALAAAGALGTGVALWAGWGRAGSVPLMASGLALLWAYSFPPIRLSYRGGGELLQMLGVGVVLPLIGYQAQAGTLAGFPCPLLLALAPMNLACAISTALPDRPSDARADKRTLAVTLGGARARALIVSLELGAVAAFWVWGYPSLAPALEAPTWMLALAPLAATLAIAPLAPGAAAGTRRVLGVVFLGILSNLALTAGLILDLATR